MAEKIVEYDSLEMYQTDQAKYSVVVNRRRMIPAVQDGLKPVQRRCIYMAYKKGATSPAKRDKSGAIVGDTMGQLHCHGDCLGADTPIYLLNGTITTVETLYKYNATVEILAIDPNTMKIVPAIAHSFRIGQYANQIYNIVLSNNHIIKCTGNHPFMLPNGQYIMARDMTPYMRLNSKNLYINDDKHKRPTIDGKMIQDIVSDYYNGPVKQGYVKHHKDFNPNNNTRDNIQILSRSDHALVHQNDPYYSSLYNEGLEKGRQSMFSENGKYRIQTERKNKILRGLFNKEQGLRKFKYYIEELKNQGKDITYENYESLRGEIYNLPIIENLLEKYPQYNCHSFEDLVELKLPSIGELYDIEMAKVIHPFYFEKEKNNVIPLINAAEINIINNLIDSGLPYTLDSYKNLRIHKNLDCNMSDDNIIKTLDIYKFTNPFIVDIFIEDVENVPMYDFTVDGFENMLIPAGSSKGTPMENILGNCIGMVPAHNSSIYSSIVTMVNWFKTKYPLFWGKGNWGTLSGSGAAAMRYTECSLSSFGYDVYIDELAQSKNIVDWLETYKRNGDMEPEYLPSKLPMILLNGSFGIGLGMQCNIPSHNLGEVIDATLKLINNPNAEVVLVPDFPQPCDIIDTNWKEISTTGGTIKVRGRILTEQDKKGNYSLRIISLPDQVTTDKVCSKLNEMIKNKQLPMIKDIYDGVSNDGHVNIIIKLRPGVDPEYVKQIIFTKTATQSTFRVNFEVVSPDGLDMVRYSYKNYLLQFIDQRMNIKFRLYCNKLQQILTKHYKVDAFIKVLESGQINTIINMIRKYKGTDDGPIIEFMIKKCNISDIQAKFIIGVNLSRLSAGHLKKYKEERKELEIVRDQYQAAISDDGTIIKNEIIEELKALKKKYDTPRLCNLISASEEDNIPAGIFKIVITEKNYIRKIPDIDKIGVIRKDNPKFIIRVDNRDNLLIFDNKGKVFKIPVSKIPITDKQGVGTDVRILIKQLTSDIAAVYDEEIFKKISKSDNKHYLAILTKSNTIKKLDIEDFLNVSPSGLMYSKIRPEDEAVGVVLVPHNLDIAICSGKKALRCSMKDIPLYKRNATGAKAMNTNNPINGLSVFYPNVTDIVVVTKNGKFNRFPVEMMKQLSRAKAGNSVIKLDSSDEILNIYGVNSGDKIRVLTTEGVEEVSIDDIKVKSSIAAGQKMLKTKGIIVRADVTR